MNDVPRFMFEGNGATLTFTRSASLRSLGLPKGQFVEAEEFQVLQDECSNLKARAFINVITQVSAMTMMAGELAALMGKLFDMRAELEHTEELRANASRNASAFEDRIGDLQAENGALMNGLRGMSATNGAAYARLSSQRNSLRAELNACAATLPGTLYMDPPDGGDVSVPEQLARMAADAARFRHLSDLFGNAKSSACEQVLWGLGLTGDVCDDLGVIVDASRADTAVSVTTEGEILPGGQYFAQDGTFMNADGTRSIFCDVDK